MGGGEVILPSLGALSSGVVTAASLGCSLTTVFVAARSLQKAAEPKERILLGLVGVVALVDAARAIAVTGHGRSIAVVRNELELAVALLFLASLLLVKGYTRDHYESQLRIRFFEANQKKPVRLTEPPITSSSGDDVPD
jgi:tellurite resistance protein TehA-like permease